MTFRELAIWAKYTQKLNEQVIIALQEEEDEPDEILQEVGKVCYLPFVAHTTVKHYREIRGELWPEDDIERLHIDLWENEKEKTVDRPYTWQNLLDWINDLRDSDIEATALCAWHLCKLKCLQNGMLYAYEEE